MNRPSMTSLANQYGSDKGTEGPDVAWGSTSNYTDVYEAYLWPERDEPIRLLEIGMGVTGDAWDARIVRGKNKEGERRSGCGPTTSPGPTSSGSTSIRRPTSTPTASPPSSPTRVTPTSCTRWSRRRGRSPST